MIKLERFEVMNFENAMRGARNPLNSWARMDSKTENGVFTFGPNDLDLAKRLCKAGSDHSCLLYTSCTDNKSSVRNSTVVFL